jgi:hypothetical protein
MLFSAIDDKQAVIRNTKNGVFKQVKLYERNGDIYAAAAGGFIRLLVDGRTSHPNMKWDDIEVRYEPVNNLYGSIKLVEQRAVQ